MRLAALAVFVPASGIGVGYFAADLERLQFTSSLNFTTEAEAHTRDLAESTHLRASAIEGPLVQLKAEAEKLFVASSKGPRADFDPDALQTSAQAKQRPMQVASITGMSTDITGSLTRADEKPAAPEISEYEAALLAAIERAAKSDRVAEQIDRRAGMVPEPMDTKPSSALFLASVNGPNDYSFPDIKPEGAVKLPRGLVFQGETEDEYQARQRRCLATAIYFEARGEPIRGQLAVAQVVMNRVRSSLYPDTICGVVFQGQHRRTGCQFSFTCDGHADVPREEEQWLLSNQLAKKVTDGEVWDEDIGHATHYHATYVKPAWRRQLDHVQRIGRHIFYTVKDEQIVDPLTLPENQGKDLTLAKSE